MKKPSFRATLKTALDRLGLTSVGKPEDLALTLGQRTFGQQVLFLSVSFPLVHLHVTALLLSVLKIPHVSFMCQCSERPADGRDVRAEP